VPTIPGGELAINSDGFFDLEEQPQRVAVVGTGYIGIELAGIFNTLGTQTTVFSRTQHILRNFDPIIRDNLLTEMQSVGVNFTFDSKVNALKRNSNGTIQVDYESDGKSGQLEVDCVLWATGRDPNVKGLNLDAAQVESTDRGYIVVDDYQNTSVAGLYALGDVCGREELTPGK
jgi:glutathione reductase (NADPH)